MNSLTRTRDPSDRWTVFGRLFVAVLVGLIPLFGLVTFTSILPPPFYLPVVATWIALLWGGWLAVLTFQTMSGKAALVRLKRREEDFIEPLVNAHNALTAFDAKVSAGLTYGGVLEEWPNVSAVVVVALAQVEVASKDFPESEVIDTLAYKLAIARSAYAWAETVDAVRGHICDEEPESAISTTLSAVDSAMLLLDGLKDNALTPANSPEFE